MKAKELLLSPAEARALLGEGYAFLDVRTVEEFAQGHVPGAYNIPLLFKTPAGLQPNPEFLAAVERHFRPEAKLVLGCRSGVRSEHACQLLGARGFAMLVNMAGGWSGSGQEAGWASLGFECALRAEPGRSFAELGGGTGG